jgi:hypothetical protein
MTRERLPNRRASTSFDIEVGGLKYTATVSRFADGRIGELFITNGKAGSDSDANARDAAIITSIALAIRRTARGDSACPAAKSTRQCQHPGRCRARRHCRTGGRAVKIFQITLRVEEPATDAIHRLRRGLKFLLRACRLRAVDVREVLDPPDGPTETRQP